MEQEYKVHYRNLEGLKHQISLLNRRAAKLGVSPITLTDTGRTATVEVKNDITGLVERVDVWHFITVSGETPKFAGWTLAAVVEHAEEGNLLRKTPGCTVELAGFRQGAPCCDHCKTIRNRRDTFVLLHDSGTQKQVGSNCIKDFLGAKDPHQLAKWAELCFSAGELASDAEDFEGGYSNRDRMFSVRGMIALAAAAIRNKGFVSGKRAKEDLTGMTASTTMYVLTAMNPAQGDKEGRDYFTTTDEDNTHAEKARQHVLDTLGAVDAEKLSDFEHNLLTACKCEVVERRNVGLLAFVPEYYSRAIEKAALAANRVELYFGEIKKRFRGVELTYVKSTGWDSQYGYTYLHTFAGPNAERIMWKTGSDLGLSSGDKISATFTVKSHEEYKGTLQTKVTRLEVAPVAAPVAVAA